MMKSFLQIGVVLLLLAAAGVLATIGHVLTGGEVYSIVSVLAGGTSLAGGLALSVAPANLYPHLILIAAVIGLTVAMALTHLFGSTAVEGVFGFILGAGVLGAGSNIITKMLTPKGEHVQKP